MQSGAWEARVDALSGRVRRVALLRDRCPASYAEVVEQWQTSPAFRSFFVALLADAPYQAYFFETPPVTRTTTTRGFEFVLVDSTELAVMAPGPDAFAAHFVLSQPVAGFASLGGDAWLVAPAPQGSPVAYGHLAAFARQAPMAQQHALWQAVGAAVARHLSSAPLWLSTSGLGVAWLHVRLDQRPKYYTYEPYRMQRV